MTHCTIYHNPRCSKSRQALALLEKNGYQPTIIEYLKTPPSKAELTHIIKMLGITTREVLRKGEKEYQELGLQNEEYSDQDIITMMTKHPILIERPIVNINNKAIIARPPEKLLELKSYHCASEQ